MTTALACSICFESFKTPKVLPCGHTFCIECIQRRIGDNMVKFCCAICEQNIEIPVGGAQMFITNLIVQTSSDQPLSTVTEQQKCPNHSQSDVDHFCNNCKLGLCSKCIFKQHKDHETLDIQSNQTRKTVVEKLQRSQTFIHNKIKDLEKTCTTLLETYQQLKSLCEDSCTKVTAKTEEIISDLRKRSEDTKQDIWKNLDENKLELEKTGKEVTQQIDKLKTQAVISSETSTLNILQLFPQIEELEKHCQNLDVQLPKIQYKIWQEKNVKLDVGILGSVVPSVFYIPSMYKFRFNSNDIKVNGEDYYSKDKFHQYGIVWSCSVRKDSEDDLVIYIEVSSNDNPFLDFCICNYEISLIDTVDDSKTLTKIDSNSRIQNGGYLYWWPVSWFELTDKNNGYVTSNAQFVIQLDIRQVREISFI